MGQPDPANSPGGFDFSQFIADHPEMYPEEANASGEGANQVAEGDRIPHLDSLNCDYQILLHPAQEYESVGIIHDPQSGYVPSFDQSVLSVNHDSPSQMDLSSAPICFLNSFTSVIEKTLVHSAQGETNDLGIHVNATNPQFESGFKIIQDNSTSRRKQSALKKDTGIKCEYPGCKFKGSFNRKYDLTRHTKIHNNDVKARCPIRHCDQLFHRYDKLSVHLVTQHNDTEKALCPFCKVEVSLIWLRAHVHGHHELWTSQDVAVKACRTMKGSVRSCPIPSCKNHTSMIQASELQAHLQKHHPEECIRNSESILTAGYHPEDLNLVCPVCKARLMTHTHFQLHVETEHIFTDRDRILSIAEEYKVRIVDLVYNERLSVFTPNGQCRIDVIEHIAFLRPYSDYSSHRFAILKFWPGFALHPLFPSQSRRWCDQSQYREWPYSI